MTDTEFQLFNTIEEIMEFLTSPDSDAKRVNYLEPAQPRVQIAIENLEIEIQRNK